MSGSMAANAVGERGLARHITLQVTDGQGRTQLFPATYTLEGGLTRMGSAVDDADARNCVESSPEAH